MIIEKVTQLNYAIVFSSTKQTNRNFIERSQTSRLRRLIASDVELGDALAIHQRHT